MSLLARGSMKYYFFKKHSAAAHIWTGKDTACRMYSTGGMRKSGKVYDSYGTRRICSMCQRVMGYEKTPVNKLELRDMTLYVW